MKIAVLINGSGKHLDITQYLFGYWNKLYDNITFDFYLATWADDIDYDKYDWIKSYVRLKEEDCPYDLSSHPNGMHQPHYCYTLYRANQLRKESGIKYDGVLQTRSDTYIFRELLDLLTSLFSVKQGINQDVDNSQVTSRIMYSGYGNELLNGRFWTSDYFFFGHPEAFDKFANMFIDVWIKNVLPENKKTNEPEDIQGSNEKKREDKPTKEARHTRKDDKKTNHKDRSKDQKNNDNKRNDNSIHTGGLLSWQFTILAKIQTFFKN